jgi:hypothetical protein
MITAPNLFRLGLKEGCYLHITQADFHELSSYPYVELKDDLRLYVQTTEQANDFIENHLTPYGKLPFDEEAMGKILGYPPLAIKDYMKGIRKKNRIAVCYHGLEFVCHRKHVKACLQYLEETMPISKELAEAFQSTVSFAHPVKRNGKYHFEETTLVNQKRMVF